MRDGEIYRQLADLEGKVANDNLVILSQLMLSRARMGALERVLCPKTRWGGLKLLVMQILSPKTVLAWIDDAFHEIYLEQQQGIRKAKNEANKAILEPPRGVLRAV